MDCQLIHFDQGVPLTRLIDYALYTVTHLQFAVEYNSLGVPDQNEYSDKAFDLCKRRDIERLCGHPAGLATLKQTFKTCHCKDVRSCNHLLNLYRLVSDFTICYQPLLVLFLVWGLHPAGSFPGDAYKDWSTHLQQHLCGDH